MGVTDDNPICQPCRDRKHKDCEYRDRWCQCSNGYCETILRGRP